MPSDPPLTAFALNCTLKSSKAEEKSSTDKLIADMLAAMKPHGSPARWSAPPTTTSSPA